MKTPHGRSPSGSPNRSATSAEIRWNRAGFSGVQACMGQPDVARVDVASLHAIARQYEAAADIVEGAVRTHLSGLVFDGAAAGRMHVARGDGLRTAVDQVVDQLRQWARAATEIAAALRASADRYAEADARAARRVG
jgi:Excreted virulence factor EspC, type VII ESX diderm